METASGELTDFCLVLTPDAEAVARASDAVRSRFKFLAEETRVKLVAAVAERAERAVARGSGRPVTVLIALEPDSLRGEVSDNGERDSFEIPLAG